MNKNATSELITRGIYVNQFLLMAILKKLGTNNDELDMILTKANNTYDNAMKKANETSKKYLEEMEKIYEGMKNE